MKKILPLILAAALMLSLTACGGDNGGTNTNSGDNISESNTGESVPTKESLLEEAGEPVSIWDLQNELYENEARARQNYLDKSIIVYGEILEIESDHLIIGNEVMLDAYLSTDELTQVNSGDTVYVVGIISDIQDIEIDWGGVPYSTPHYIMDIGFLTEQP